MISSARGLSVTGTTSKRRQDGWKATVFGALLASAGGLAVGPAIAADIGSPADAKPALWIITLGGYGVYEPKAEGSKTYHTTGRPIFSFRKSTDREWLQLPNDGTDYEVIETDQLRAGPAVTGRWGAVGPATARGTRNVNVANTAVAVSLEAGAFVEYWPVDWLRNRVELRAAAVGGAGYVGDVTVDAIWRPNSAMTVNAGPRLSVADGSYMDSYYGVSAQQAALLNVSKFDAGAGLRSYGMGAGFKYKFTPQVTGLGYVEYQRLAGSAADSPLIAKLGTPDQVTFGLGASYDFHLDW
jgi:MipA family protein